MKRCVQMVALFGAVLVLATPAAAQDSPAAKETRKRLHQKISVEWKEIGVKAITEDIKRELDKPVGIKIDNTTGVSNNSKLTYKADNKSAEEVLNGISEKGEFGWFIKSDPKDRNDGFVIIRKYKDKERGYEGGKEPKKGTSLSPGNRETVPSAAIEAIGFARFVFIKD